MEAIDHAFEEEFVRQDPLRGKIDAIRVFQLTAELSKIAGWQSQELRSKVATDLYDTMLKVISDAGFFYRGELTPFLEGDERVRLDYNDDVFSFSVRCDGTSVIVSRPGSSMAAFYRWYKRIMPYMGDIMNAVLASLTKHTGREISFIGSNSSFQFILYDVRRMGDPKVLRNVDIIKKLLTGFPDENGVVSNHQDGYVRVARSDYLVNRWMAINDSQRQVSYKVEAPANRQWSSIWFTFAYGIQSFTDPLTQERSDFAAEDLFREWKEILHDFLAERALKNFVGSMMSDYSFSCVTHALP